jgi:hypothetical protein
MIEEDHQSILGYGLCPQRIRPMRQDSAYGGLPAQLRLNPLQKQSRSAQARVMGRQPITITTKKP